MKIVPILYFLLILCVSCSKDDPVPTIVSKNYITVQIDHLGDGGLYNDDISGVPYGLTQGINGPFEFDADEKEYHVSYKPNNNWTNPITLTWYAHESYDYTIHCYVTYSSPHNYAHIDVLPELK